MTTQRSVSSVLRDLRTQRGESLRSAARGVGVDAAHLARIESGEKEPSGSLCARLSGYYAAEPDEIYLAAGRLPPDVVELLLQHPEEIQELRERVQEGRR